MTDNSMFDDMGLMSGVPEETPIEIPAPTDFTSAMKMIYAIRKQEEEIDGIAGQKEEAEDFYDRRMEAKRRNIEYMKGHIKAFLIMGNETKIVSHLGTAYIAKRTEKIWPDEATMIEYAKQKKIPGAFVEKFVPGAVREWCKANSSWPAGYHEEPREGLVIRNPGT